MVAAAFVPFGGFVNARALRTIGPASYRADQAASEIRPTR